MDDPITRCLVILQDGPYGSDRGSDARRLASSLVRKPGTPVDVFLVGDGVQCAVRGRSTPDGFYNVEKMLQPVLQHGIGFTRGTCAKARGLGPSSAVEGVEAASMKTLADLVLQGDRTIAF